MLGQMGTHVRELGGQGVRVGEEDVHGAVEDDKLAAAPGGPGHPGRLDLHGPLEGGQFETNAREPRAVRRRWRTAVDLPA